MSRDAGASMSSVKSGKVRRSARIQEKPFIGDTVINDVNLPVSKKIKRDATHQAERPLLSEDEVALCTTLAQPRLPFSLDDARDHLCNVDARFLSLFSQMDLKTYNDLSNIKELNLFRVLTTSILGQQISWMAARSIVYKFCRLFSPYLPANPDMNQVNRDELPFPTPLELLQVTDEQLRSAGLSMSKIKYIRDVAQRFGDGRLDVRKIIHLDPETCIQELTEVKGVGRWTAEMLLMFALRSPDILPAGDLGVQRGIIRFYLSNAASLTVSERKRKVDYAPQAGDDQPGLLPPGSISYGELTNRANGNKTKKNMYLDEHEMVALAAPWAPYRSVACMFMWSIEGN